MGKSWIQEGAGNWLKGILAISCLSWLSLCCLTTLYPSPATYIAFNTLTVWGVQPVIIPQTSWLESTDLYTWAIRVMQEHACPHPHHVCSSDISICSGLQGAQNSRNNSMIAHIGAESSRRRCAQTVLQGEGCTDCSNPYSHSIT